MHICIHVCVCVIILLARVYTLRKSTPQSPLERELGKNSYTGVLPSECTHLY